MMKKRKSILYAAIIAVLLGGALILYLVLRPQEPSGVSGDEQQILTVPAKAGSVSIRVEGPSVVEPYLSQDIRSKIEGQITTAAVEGDSFAKGDVLLQLDRTEQVKDLRQAEIGLSQAVVNRDRARATMEKAKTDFDTAKRLFSTGAIPKEQMDLAQETLQNAEYGFKSAELTVSQALLSLETARENLNGTSIRAPFDGIVLRSSVTAGDLVSKGALLLTFADLSRIRLQAEVDEFDIGKVQPGQPVTITSDALGETSLTSKVERVSPAAEVINNISVFKVSTVLDNRDGRLRPGMSADISILISSDKGIVVPSKAVSTVRTRSYVKVFEEDEIKTKRVTIGANDGVNVAVLEGLEEGDLVVLPGTAGISLTSQTQSSSGSSVVPITVPGTGGTR
jgi:HlyD family secretion protein